MSEALSQQIFGTTTAWWGDGRNRTTPPVFVSDLELLRQSMPVAADRLTHLSGLKDGWNGDGSIRISRTSLEVCAELLCSLASCSHHLVRLAFISPLSSGGIELEWDSLHSKDLLLSIPTNGSPIEYLISHPDSGDTIEEGIVGTQEAICLFKTERCNQLSTMVFPSHQPVQTAFTGPSIQNTTRDTGDLFLHCGSRYSKDTVGHFEQIRANRMGHEVSAVYPLSRSK